MPSGSKLDLELLSPEMRQFVRDVEEAAKRQGISSRDGLCLDPETGLISDAMAWELESED